MGTYHIVNLLLTRLAILAAESVHVVNLLHIDGICLFLLTLRGLLLHQWRLHHGLIR